MLCSYFTDGECRNTSGGTPSENQTTLGNILQPRMSPSQICQRTILKLNMDISTSILRKKKMFKIKSRWLCSMTYLRLLRQRSHCIGCWSFFVILFIWWKTYKIWYKLLYLNVYLIFQSIYYNSTPQHRQPWVSKRWATLSSWIWFSNLFRPQTSRQLPWSTGNSGI